MLYNWRPEDFMYEYACANNRFGHWGSGFTAREHDGRGERFVTADQTRADPPINSHRYDLLLRLPRRQGRAARLQRRARALYRFGVAPSWFGNVAPTGALLGRKRVIQVFWRTKTILLASFNLNFCAEQLASARTPPRPALGVPSTSAVNLPRKTSPSIHPELLGRVQRCSPQRSAVAGEQGRVIEEPYLAERRLCSFLRDGLRRLALWQPQV